MISLFVRVSRLMVEDLLERLRAAGYENISFSAHQVFESLPPGGARLTTLAAGLAVTHQSVGEVVADLERRDLLARVPDPLDRRARLIVLTDRGRELVRIALAEIEDIERTWSDRLAAAGLSGDLGAALSAVVDEGRPVR
ncbi:MarR family transcriptional regulator [Actinomycetospora sp. NBRC 106378]|uniref:MarR family winged helix-turn-helix transcriptional regulator n=1 Tax=Actinomycetospora sp. NBRC 106378 TaxID=3032208 RepID=UPI0025523192|nr:MarR family transcriptional regulator [Actinomycetospora sp. NBRC 106378]